MVIYRVRMQIRLDEVMQVNRMLRLIVTAAHILSQLVFEIHDGRPRPRRVVSIAPAKPILALASNDVVLNSQILSAPRREMRYVSDHR